MARAVLLALLLAGVTNVPKVLANSCSSVQIPIIQDITFDKTARSPLPAATLTFRTQHKILDYAFYAYEHENSEAFIIAESSDDYSQSLESTSQDYILKFMANREFKRITFVADFDLAGCNRLDMYLGITRQIEQGQFGPFDIGKFEDMQPLNRIVEPGKIYKMKFAMNTEQHIRPNGQIASFRNISGVFENSDRSPDSNPIEFNVEKTSRPGEDPEISVWFEWPAGLYDMVFRAAPRIRSEKVDQFLDYAIISYHSNMHTDDELPPEVRYHSCNGNPETMQPEEENGEVKVWTIADGYACLAVSLFGNPLPEVALAQMSGASRVEKLIDIVPKYEMTDTYDKKYFMDDTIIGYEQKKQYVLAIKDRSSGGTTFKYVTLIGYRPFQFVDFSYVALNGTTVGEVTLECKVSGPYEKIGFYTRDDGEYGDRENESRWQPLKEYPTPSDGERTAEFVYNLEITEDVLEEIQNYRIHYFCGVVGKFKNHVRDYYFNTYSY